MTGQLSDDELREMALNRGFRLIKSRRRKAGTADLGKFGLTDSQGKKLFGFGAEGLEASGQDIEAYLRAGTASTWQRSAASTSDRATGVPGSSHSPEVVPARTARVGKRSGVAPDPKLSNSPQAIGKENEPESSARLAQARTAKGNRTKAKRQRVLEVARKGAVTGKTEEPLIIRASKPSDAGGIADLLTRSRLEISDKAGAVSTFLGGVGDLRIAQRGEIVGCVAWSLVPTLQRGTIGRISLLLVDEGNRRRGIGGRRSMKLRGR
ncbi:hypothetical protein WBP07_21075 (plasmid) [Novosphingobium sp. BL-8A]|uniref:hypothetical protein n=1 Tax=Novosphingobium sp. BL-8A TaxID=3127639 RepID=UPI0037581244